MTGTVRPMVLRAPSTRPEEPRVSRTDDAATAPADGPERVADVLRQNGVRSHLQPIVHLESARIAGYEALARGPEGRLQSPAALFAAARAEGLLAELDQACRRAAFGAAVEHGLVSPVALFVNVEPEVLDTAPLDELLAIADGASASLRVVVEITERALAARPAELLRTVERVRDLGWGVALDDVGAETTSLAFMPLLRPDVVKLDLRLTQDRPGPELAEIMNAVNAYAERSGALVLAEGIETERHLATAQALGATLGQGWFFGRPTARPEPVDPIDAQPLRLLATGTAPAGVPGPSSPFSCLPPGAEPRRSRKRLLVEISKQLEREAMRVGSTCVVASTFQHVRHLTPATEQRYRDLAERVGFVCAVGEGLAEEPVAGVRGATLDPGDPVLGEWDVAVIGPHFAAALLARDLGDDGPDPDRTFEYVLTYDRDVVAAAVQSLLSRVAPRRGSTASAAAVPATGAPSGPGADRATAGAAGAEYPAEEVSSLDSLPVASVLRALTATTSGICIADMTRPDQPLVFVNPAFEALAGFPAAELLGRNCRLLQGPDTDRRAVSRIRAGLRAGTEVRELLLNVRGADREPWWNEVHLSPVHDEDGRVVQYVGVQNDVTARVEAERALRRASDQERSYLARIEELAYTDSLTGLMNRRRFDELLEVALWEARAGGTGVAVLFLDLDGFKAVNDVGGHGDGDDLLQTVARRLRGRVRRSDLLARLGGDEFLVALRGLPLEELEQEARRVADDLTACVREPVVLGGRRVSVGVSVGISTFPGDAAERGGLVHAADLRMYEVKDAARTA
jgi:diguanylate cyclase (GGDEF)-like protein/PAS domain S-box-containing protein